MKFKLDILCMMEECVASHLTFLPLHRNADKVTEPDIKFKFVLQIIFIQGSLFLLFGKYKLSNKFIMHK